MNKTMSNRWLALGIVLACGLNIGSGYEVSAQDRHWGGGGDGHSHRGSGALRGEALAPSIIADALLVPSLTKEQKTKVRALYIEYRAKQAGRMDVMRKLRGTGSSSMRGSEHDGSSPDSRPRGSDKSSGSNLADKNRSGKSKNSGSPGDPKKPGLTSSVETGANGGSSNIRRSMFITMMKDFAALNENVIAVLTEKQHAELKEIAKAAGSTDYFANRHYDIMNDEKMRAPATHGPD